MYRLYKIVSHTSKNYKIIKLARPQSLIEWQQITTNQRFHTKHKDFASKDDQCKQVKSDTGPESPCPPKCKPYPVSPCRMPKQTQKYPRLQECPKPNIMSECPQPEDPCEDDSGKNRKPLIVGLLLTAATLGALYYFTSSDKKPEKPKASKIKKPKTITKDPAQSSEIPKEVPYLLIGGGTAAFSAFRAIKSSDPKAKVLIITNESHNPYMRPPLSKELWFNDDPETVKKLEFKQWNGSQRSLFYEPSDFYLKCKDLSASENGGVAVAKGWTIKRLDVINKKAYLEDDTEISYEKCLLATGAIPKNLTVFEDASPNLLERISLYRNIFNFSELYDQIKKADSVAIVGGGFLGSELACSLARKGKDTNLKVYQIFKEKGNMGKILPEYLSLWTTEKIKAEGVEVIPSASVLTVRPDGTRGVSLGLSGSKAINVNHVIVAVGVEPNTELAETSDLEVDSELGGYLVNTELQARSHLYAAGDCACFYDPQFGRRRIEHHDHAVVSGRLAGENMSGSSKPYVHQSMFWSDLGPDVGYEAIGIVDSCLPTVGVFAKATDKDNPKAVVAATDENIRSDTEETQCKRYLSEEEMKDMKAAETTKKGDDYGKGIIFYLKNDIVVGIVLWNVFNRMSIARQVLKENRKYDDLNEVAKLFSIHEE